ncbi:MAG: hypothetical protein CMJ18_15025 [Phycisphaeraceae bacterium]|nr:hypothetical protein [Phycisphaeraceae bacterium]
MVFVVLLNGIVRADTVESDVPFNVDGDTLEARPILDEKWLWGDEVEMTGLDRDLVGVATLIGERRYVQAVDRLMPLTRKHPETVQVWFVLTVARYGRGQYDLALASADRCVQLRPHSPEPLWLRASILVAQGHLHSAESNYRRAIELNPKRPVGYLQRARFYISYRSEDPAKMGAAVTDIEQAAQRGASEAATEAMLGHAYEVTGDVRRAVTHYRSAIDARPGDLYILGRLVPLYDQAGLAAQSDALLSAIDGSKLGNPRKVARLATIRASHGIATGMASEKIERYYRDALLVTPNDLAVRLEFARWLETDGRNAAAIPVLRKALQSEPYDPQAAAQLAWALADDGKELDEARRWYAVAKQHDPSSPYLLDTGAWIEYQAGEYDRALEVLQPSLRLAKQVPEIAYHAGAIYARLNEPDKARRFLRMALAAKRPFNGRAAAEALLEQLH